MKIMLETNERNQMGLTSRCLACAAVLSEIGNLYAITRVETGFGTWEGVESPNVQITVRDGISPDGLAAFLGMVFDQDAVGICHNDGTYAYLIHRRNYRSVFLQANMMLPNVEAKVRRFREKFIDVLKRSGSLETVQPISVSKTLLRIFDR